MSFVYSLGYRDQPHYEVSKGRLSLPTQFFSERRARAIGIILGVDPEFREKIKLDPSSEGSTIYAGNRIVTAVSHPPEQLLTLDFIVKTDKLYCLFLDRAVIASDDDPCQLRVYDILNFALSGRSYGTILVDKPIRETIINKKSPGKRILRRITLSPAACEVLGNPEEIVLKGNVDHYLLINPDT